MPPARPMYWPKMRVGRDAADQVRREVAVQDAEPVVPVHRPGRAGRDGLLPEAVVEGAGDLALAVEHHRPLLDAAHREHRAQEADPVLQRQVLGILRSRLPAERLVPRARLRRRYWAYHSPLVSNPFLDGRSGIRRRTLAGAGCPRGIAAASLAVFGPRLPSGGWDTRSGCGRRGVRWRMRGAWLWPALRARTLRRRRAADPRSRRTRACRPASSGACCWPASRTCS